MSDLLNSASLVMIPSGYKEDVVYSQIPTDGSGDLSFTRASNGTRINSAGLVEVCPWNFNTTSENFTANWGTDGTSTATNNFTTAPNGTTTAAKVVANSPSGYGYKFLPVSAGVYTLSLYVKANINSTFSLALNDINGSGLNQSSIFNVTTEWQRFEFSCNITDGALLYINYDRLQTSREYYFWGLQLNIGSTAKPYFPTTDRLNVPRLTYQNGGGGCPSLLLEKQSTNLATYSEQLDNAAWTKIGSTISSNVVTSPDGTQDADKIAEDNSTQLHYVSQGGYMGSAGAYSASIYLKAAERTWAFVYIYNGTDPAGTLAFFNLSNGTIGTVDPAMTASITDVGNGWYRCIINRTIAGNAAAGWGFGTSTGNGNSSFTGTTGSGIYAWGAQCELSSYATSYIPTTSSSATRVADACYKTGISSLIGQTEGVVFWDIEVETLSATGNENILNIDAGSYGNTIYLIKGSTGILTAEIYVTGVAQCSFSFSLPSVGRYKMALAYKANDFAFYVNGVSRGTDSSGSVPATSRLQLGNGVFGPSDGKVNQAILFPTRLTNAELASLTTI